MTILQLLLPILALISNTKAIWPPGYSINLTEEGTFVIAEDIQSDIEDVYSEDDEMIKESDLRKTALEEDAAKYYQIHKMAMQRNKAQRESNFKVDGNVKVFESNFEHEEPLPWEAGFVDKKGNVINEVRVD